MRSLSARRTCASCTRSLTPAISPASAASRVPTSWPSRRRMSTTSVRYSCALLVVGRHPLDRVGQQRAVEGVAAGVVLVDGPLGGRGVALLDDAQERPGRVAHDPPVAGGVTARGQHGDRVARRLVRVDQLAQRLAAQQRHVAVADDHGAGDGADRLQHHPHRVAGAELLVLHHDVSLGRGGQGSRGDLLPRVPDDHDQPLRGQLLRRGQRVPEQRPAAQRVQDLGGAGLHPGALAGGEDHHCGRGSFAHAQTRLLG